MYDIILAGASLAGAGGGGFLILVTKEPDAIPKLQERLKAMDLKIPGQTFHAVTVDMKGLTVEVVAEDK